MASDTPDTDSGDEEQPIDALETQLDQVKQQLVGALEEKNAEIERLEAQLDAERERRAEQQDQFEQLQRDIEELQENYIPLRAVETVLAKHGVSEATIEDVIAAARVVEDNAEANVSE